MNYHDITYPDINNGIGLRVTLWVSGCDHHCKGCHNPQTWNVNSGIKFDRKALQKIYDVLSLSYISGLTISGGDPLHDNNIVDVCMLLYMVSRDFPNKTIWLYTGYTLKEIVSDTLKWEAASICDVIVDGTFEIEQKDLSLAWCGSKNQRVIDMKKTIEAGSIVLYKS